MNAIGYVLNCILQERNGVKNPLTASATRNRLLRRKLETPGEQQVGTSYAMQVIDGFEPAEIQSLLYLMSETDSRYGTNESSRLQEI